MLKKNDNEFLARALELATRGMGHTRPNPAVGAVIVKNGKIVGEGWHKKAGGDHAEVAAIKDATRRGNSTRDATIYVTLEPCSKPGRVGACTDAIIAAGIKRVVYGAVDPNPKNRGKAKRALAKHGIICVNAGARRPAVQPVHGAGPSRPRETKSLIASAGRLIAPFAKHVTTGLPYVTVKIAMSLDGKICDDYGNARWISSAESRKMTGRLREHVDAIMVGAETVRKDNPSLLSHGRRNDDLIRVVISKSGKLPKTAQVFTDGKNPTLVFDDAKKALRELGKMGVMSVLCEGGLKLARSLADAGLVDEWMTVMAPVYIGSKHISKAIRGTAFYNTSFLASGDSFYTAGLSDFSTWSGAGADIKFDAKDPNGRDARST